MGAGGETLPLGLFGSGILLVVFTCIKSSISLLLVAAREGRKDGFPFLFETVLVFPFTMQAIFYTAQTCQALDWQLAKGIQTIKAAATSMGPCVFYAGFITSTTVLETYSLQFILPSTFVVLKQLTMVVIALGEVILFAERPSRNSWALIFGQAVCVGLFQYSSSFQGPVAPRTPSLMTLSAQEAAADSKENLGVPSVHAAAAAAIGDVQDLITSTRSPAVADFPVHAASALTTGITACLASVATGGFGNILQQRFMQKQAKGIPVSVKLFYQHAIELFIVLMLLQLRSEGRARLWEHGFFGGWSRWTAGVSVTMWFSFLSASAISAYISAIAGAFAVAVSVALTGGLEFALFDRSFTPEQFTLMGSVCIIAVLYTRERLASTPASHEQDEEKTDRLGLPVRKGEGKKHEKDDNAPQECHSLCEFGLDDFPLYNLPEKGTAPTAFARQSPNERTLNELC